MKNNRTFKNVTYEMLEVAELKVGEYQRKIDIRKTRAIAAEFDPRRLGVIQVSRRNGNNYVFDGQHRVFVLKLLKIPMVMCEVHHGMSYEDEARLFAEQDEGTTAVSVHTKFNALVEAGDEKSVELKNIVENSGFTIVGNSHTDYGISALNTLIKIYNNSGPKRLKTVLHLIGKTWDGSPRSTNSKLLNGVDCFYGHYKEMFNENTYIKQLRKTLPDEILRDGTADLSTRDTGIKYAKQILLKYNYGLKEANKLPYRFNG